MKFSIGDFFSKCNQIRRKLRIGSLLLKKSLIENFIFCTVNKVDSHLTIVNEDLIINFINGTGFNPLMHNAPKWSNTL